MTGYSHSQYAYVNSVATDEDKKKRTKNMARKSIVKRLNLLVLIKPISLTLYQNPYNYLYSLLNIHEKTTVKCHLHITQHL